MLPIIAADPSQQDSLKDLAKQAQAGLKGGELDVASGHISVLSGLLDRIGTPSPAPARGGSGTPAAKARLAWMATRQKLDSDIGQLDGAFTAAFGSHPMAGELTKTFKTRVDQVLSNLDEALADKLDEVNNAANPEERAKLVGQARNIIERYKAHVASDPTIAALDTNPFTPMNIQKTVTATLNTLGKALG